jgi:UDP:flavonoid glycosyltransferase YjiC (YdhE family)
MVSLGERLYESYLKKLNNFTQSNKNVLLMPSVPQVEVLERASLFITHAGMNSISEAIRNAVPCICIPLRVDQPMNALRLCDDLKLGKRFDPFQMRSDELAKAIENTLDDHNGFRERMIEMSAKCNQFNNGAEIASNLILKFINEKCVNKNGS